MATLKELGEWLEEDSGRDVYLNFCKHDEGYLFSFSLYAPPDKKPLVVNVSTSVHGALEGLNVPPLRYKKGDIICELCYKITKDKKCPASWDLMHQSYCCNKCMERLLIEGTAFAEARGGCYASCPDPRGGVLSHKKTVVVWVETLGGKRENTDHHVDMFVDANPTLSARQCAERILKIVDGTI